MCLFVSINFETLKFTIYGLEHDIGSIQLSEQNAELSVRRIFCINLIEQR